MSSAVLATLFTSRVVTREGAIADVMPAIHGDELASVARAVPARQREFATGRLLARSALEALGVNEFVLTNDAQGAPKWPAKIVGSITHTGGRRTRPHDPPGAKRSFVGVAVAPADTVRSVAVDAEDDCALTEDLWHLALRGEELRSLSRLGPIQRLRRASLIFSAKECYYKCQFPLTRQLLDFFAAAIEVDDDAKTFRVLVRERAGELFTKGDTLHGRFASQDGLVFTAMELPR